MFFLIFYSFGDNMIFFKFKLPNLQFQRKRLPYFGLINIRKIEEIKKVVYVKPILSWQL